MKTVIAPAAVAVPILVLLFSLSFPSARAETPSTVPVTKTDAVPPRPLPLRADSGLTQAEAQIAEGKYTQALDTLSGVLARRPGDADALTYTGYVWQSLGDAQQAAAHYDRAIKYDPRHLGANTYRAELYLEEGEFSRALEQLQAVRLVCAGSPCAEIDRLQSGLNAARKGKKDDPERTARPDTSAPPN